MWMQLQVEKTIDGTRYRPGDWYDADKQTARRWLAQTEVWVPPHRAKELLPTGSGIVVSRITKEVKALAQRFELGLVEGPPELRFARTLIWDTAIALRPELVPVGFGLLETWQVAVPLRDYDILAANLGTAEERKRTEDVIHDLRVMAYEPGILFVQDCEEAGVLLRRWEREGRGDLAFLRALYQTKPMVLALPSVWAQKA